jgi:prevent-host-death family protein
MVAWAIQDAKNKFSELVQRTQTEGPQVVTRHGHPEAVVISFEDYQKQRKPSQDLVQFMRQSPLFGVDLDLSRDSDTGRLEELF